MCLYTFLLAHGPVLISISYTRALARVFPRWPSLLNENIATRTKREKKKKIALYLFYTIAARACV